MEYRIEERDAFRVVGYQVKGNWTLEDSGQKAVEFWEYLEQDDARRIHKVLSLMDGSDPQQLLGVCFCDDGAFDGYLVGVATSAACPDDMVAREVPAATYAIFDCVGPMPNAIQRVQHRILAEWLPSSGYEWAPKADLELYFGPNMTSEDYRSQVWLPIQKRQA